MKSSINHNVLIGISSILALSCTSDKGEKEKQRPNILIAISDDQSYPHTSFAGCEFVNTPAFDRIAKNGVYFTNCMAASPGCAPSRSGLVTGHHHWQNEQSGQHAAGWMAKYVPMVDMFDTYPRYSHMRYFPVPYWAEDGKR